MALDIKKLGIRSASAAVFVIVLLGGILLNYYSFTILFLFISIAGLKEFFVLAALCGARPYKIAGYAGGLITYGIFVRADAIFPQTSFQLNALLLAAIPFVILAIALFSNRERPLLNAVFTMAGIIYAVLPFAMLHELVILPGVFTGTPVFFPNLLLAVIFLIWSNDTFAYLGGSLFGKHKLIERVSPGKTWEGTLCGIAVTVGVSFVIRRLMFPESVTLFWPMMGLLVPVLATAGDLVESSMKREAGVKDSGKLMPGHGGILDRFDSLIFVSPFLVVLLKLL